MNFAKKSPGQLSVIATLSLFLILGVYSCKSNGDDGKNTEYEIEWVDSEFPEEQDTIMKAGKGSAAKNWKALFDECIKSDWFKKPFYFGATNNINLGAIVNKKDQQLIRKIDNAFSEVEIAKMVNPGEVVKCELRTKIDKDVNLDALLTGRGEIASNNAELGTALSKQISSTISISGYQVDDLIIGQLKDALKVAESPEKLNYIEDFVGKKNLILAKVVKVSGFSAEIEVEGEFSSALKAQLTEGTIIPIADAKVDISFSLKNEKTLLAESSGDFYVFGKFAKGRKLVK